VVNEWIDAFAARLGQDPVTREQADALLGLARDIARGTDDRRLAPLSAFLAGVLAGRSGDDRAGAIRAAQDAARELLSDSEPPGGDDAG
jgi:hypothetical protein